MIKKTRKLTSRDLDIIAKMMVPRPYWGSSYRLSEEDTCIWVDRVENNAAALTTFEITIPPEIAQKRYAVCSGHQKSREDRARILDVLNQRFPENAYTEARDCQLRYIYSDVANDILFSSNVELGRVNRLIDYHNVRKFGWASIQRMDGFNHVMINHVELTCEQFEKERLQRLNEEEHLLEQAKKIMSMMRE
jgi:hypothetical protein